MKQEVTRMHKKPEKGQEAWSLDDVIYKTEVKEKDFESIKEKYVDFIFLGILSFFAKSQLQNFV